MDRKQLIETIKTYIATAGVPDRAAKDVREALVAALAERSGEGVDLYSHSARRHVCPSSGVVLVYRCPFPDQDSDTWYPTDEAARAALESMALTNGRTTNGQYLDLTQPGCHDVGAWLVDWDRYRESYEGKVA